MVHVVERKAVKIEIALDIDLGEYYQIFLGWMVGWAGSFGCWIREKKIPTYVCFSQWFSASGVHYITWEASKPHWFVGPTSVQLNWNLWGGAWAFKKEPRWF